MGALNGSQNDLKWHWNYSWSIPGGFVAVSFNINAVIGWKIRLISFEPIQSVDISRDLWNVTITPFAFAYTNGLAITESPYLKLSSFTDLDFFELSIPIFLLYEKDSRICYQADIHLLPVNLNSTLAVQPAECTGKRHC